MLVSLYLLTGADEECADAQVPRVVEALGLEPSFKGHKKDADNAKETQRVGEGDDVEERRA